MSSPPAERATWEDTSQRLEPKATHGVRHDTKVKMNAVAVLAVLLLFFFSVASDFVKGEYLGGGTT